MLFALNAGERFARDAEYAAAEPRLAERRDAILGGPNREYFAEFTRTVRELRARGYRRVLLLAGRGTNALASTAFHLAYPTQIVVVDPESLGVPVPEALADRDCDAALVPGPGGRFRIVERRP